MITLWVVLYTLIDITDVITKFGVTFLENGYTGMFRVIVWSNDDILEVNIHLQLSVLILKFSIVSIYFKGVHDLVIFQEW